jgi:hypothetical protein
MAVPFTFGSATAAIPLSQLDTNFATTITLGNTAIQLGNTVTTLNNMTLANVTISSGNVTLTNVSVANANVTTALTLSGGTANGVAYLNGSKVLTTGSALVFDGTNLGVGTASPFNAANQTSVTINATSFPRLDLYSGGTQRAFLNSGATDTNLYTVGATPLTFGTNNTEKMRLDSSGNLGLGVTPSAWLSSVRAYQVGYGAFRAFTSSANTYVDNNNYVNSSGSDIYLNNGFAGRYRIADNQHLWYQAASGTAGNAITFTQAMTLDASGNLGIGTSSPSQKLTIQGSSNQAFLLAQDSTATVQGIYGADSVAGGAILGSLSNHPTIFRTNNTERARIDSSGNLLVGTTSSVTGTPRAQIVAPASAAGLVIQNQTVSNDTLVCWNTATSGDNSFVGFYTEGSITSRGSISYNRGAGLVAYNTTSDYRSKDIIGPVTDSGALIDSTPVYMGKMKGATIERPMFIAHETPAYAHTGEKDAVDADGNPVYQQMDTSALVPVMWAEIQSLRQRVAQLESN